MVVIPADLVAAEEAVREHQAHSQPISSMELRGAQQEELVISILKYKKLMQRTN